MACMAGTSLVILRPGNEARLVPILLELELVFELYELLPCDFVEL